MKKDYVALWEEATNRLTNHFVQKYYKDYDPDCNWVGDEVGGVFFCNDYFYSSDNILTFLRHDAPEDKMFAYMDYSLDCYREEPFKQPLTYKNWLATQ